MPLNLSVSVNVKEKKTGYVYSNTCLACDFVAFVRTSYVKDSAHNTSNVRK